MVSGSTSTADIAQLARNRIQIALFLHHELRHISVILFDTALGEIAGVTKILAALRGTPRIPDAGTDAGRS